MSLDRFQPPDDPHPALAELREQMETENEEAQRTRSAKAAELSLALDSVCGDITETIARYEALPGEPDIVQAAAVEWLKALRDRIAEISGEMHDL